MATNGVKTAILISVWLGWFRLEAELTKLFNSFSIPGLKSHTGELINSFHWSLDKPYGKLALGQNCIKIISDKSNSLVDINTGELQWKHIQEQEKWAEISFSCAQYCEGQKERSNTFDARILCSSYELLALISF